MSLSRNQILDEMGLSPQWMTRKDSSVVRREENPRALVASSVPESSKGSVVEVAARIPRVYSAESGVERAEQIARMGWDELHHSIAGCNACGLCAERKQAVPGVGDEKAGWLFIGEGPGAEEDARGEPFVGQAGKLLDAMLTAIDLKRGEDVYIANAVKCRPPGNRTPEAPEMAACAPYLKRQIELIQPKLLVLLGRAAVHAVLGEDASLASLRGKPLAYCADKHEIPAVVTYHPAYLLRNLPDKSKAWEDLCHARALILGKAGQ